MDIASHNVVFLATALEKASFQVSIQKGIKKNTLYIETWPQPIAARVIELQLYKATYMLIKSGSAHGGFFSTTGAV